MNGLARIFRRGNASAEIAAAPAVMAARRRGFRFQFVPMVPGAIILLLLFTAIFANLLAPFSPVGTTLADSMTPPSWVEGGTTKYLLGTDLFGRDQISRLIFGARVSLSVSLTVIILGIGLGTTIGMISGFFAGKLDSFFMRVVDMNLSFPAILIAIVMAVVFGPSFRNVILIIVFVQWARVARIMRGESLALRTQDFVTLARVAGASNRRIIMRHILPNVFPTMLVLATLEVGSVILFEASLSFLGVGIPPPQPSWGVMVADGRGQIATGWWISLFPGACIFFTCLSMNSVGDWLRDRLDPRLRTL